MERAAAVLKNENLVELISQYQNGLPLELVEITCVAESIVITPCYTQSILCPTAYLSNIPPRFKETFYLQLFKCRENLPNYALFLDDYFKEPTLPLHLSILENNIKHVDMWIKHKPEWLTPAPLKLAAICGHLEIVERLVNASKTVWTPEAMDLAAMNGHLDVVKYLHGIENGPGCTTEAMDGAATYGRLEVVVFLNENRSEGCTRKALQGAVKKGYAKVVEYLLSHRNDQCGLSDLCFCSEYYRIQCHRTVQEKDYIGVIQCLHKHSFAYINEDLIVIATKANPLSTIKFLQKEYIYGITKRLFDTIIAMRDKNTIRYALEMILTDNSKPILLLDKEDVDSWVPLDNQDLLSHSNGSDKKWGNSKAMDIAAAVGDLDTIKLLHRSGINCCTVKAMNNAAATGRLDILEWLHTYRKEGCTAASMTFAIAGGHLEVVQWLHQVRRLNCTKHGLSTAAFKGDVKMVEYLVSILITPEITNPLNMVRGGSNLRIPMPGNRPAIKVFCGIAVDRAAENGHINIVKILKDYPATTEAMDRAARNGHLDMVKYLQIYRTEGCTVEAYKSAVRTNRFDILEYLVTNKCYPGAVDFEELRIDAAGCNNINMLDFCLNQLHSDVSPKLSQLMMYKAAMCGQLDIVKWFYEVKDFGWTLESRKVAESRGYKSVVLYFNSVSRCYDKLLDYDAIWYL